MTILESLRDGVPEIVALHAARDEINRAELAQAGRADTTTATSIVNHVHAALTAGEPIPADLGARLTAAKRAAEEHHAALTALRDLRARINTDLEHADATHADTMLTDLAGRLDALLDTAKTAVARLGGARTADEVVQAGPDAVAAWNELLGLVTTYRHMRDCQWTLTRAGWERLGGHAVLTKGWLGLRMIVRDPTSLWDPFGSHPPPWPHDENEPTWPPPTDVRFVLWATAHRSAVWLPTVKQLAAAHEQQTQRDQNKNLKRRDPEEVARELQLLQRVGGVHR